MRQENVTHTGEMMMSKELIEKLKQSRHWAEEGQMWCYLIDESTHGKLQNHRPSGDVVERDEYKKIRTFYGDKCAKRSGVRLMNHIDEGLQILVALGASDLAINAFCLHPIVQGDERIDISWSSGFELAKEYRDKANAYLCCPENDFITESSQLKDIVGEMSIDCCNMLIADKIQNQKDFYLYHRNHSRFKELAAYFSIWLEYLAAMQAPAQGDDVCNQCQGTGIAGHPDSGNTCHKCNGYGGTPNAKPHPDVREALEACLMHCVGTDAYEKASKALASLQGDV